MQAMACITAKRPCDRFHMETRMSGGAFRNERDCEGLASARSRKYCQATNRSILITPTISNAMISTATKEGLSDALDTL